MTEPLGGIDEDDDPYADYEPDEDDLELLAWEPELTEAEYAAIGRVALASHRLEELRKQLARMLGKRKGWSTKDVTAYLTSRDATASGLAIWAERTGKLIERRHELVHASLDVDVDWEYQDGVTVPQPFIAVRHGHSGRLTPVDKGQWNQLAGQLLTEATDGERFWEATRTIFPAREDR